MRRHERIRGGRAAGAQALLLCALLSMLMVSAAVGPMGVARAAAFGSELQGPARAGSSLSVRVGSDAFLPPEHARGELAFGGEGGEGAAGWTYGGSSAERDGQPVPGQLSGEEGYHLGWGSQAMVLAGYGVLYGIASHVGSRHRSDGQFKVVRLETAYAYDFVGHAFLVREMGGIAAALQRAAGVPAGRARHDGVWLGAFGSEVYMEVLNGFVPGIRFDPLDPVANFVGAMMATKGRDLAARHEWIARMSLQFGYKDWQRAFEPSRDDATLGAVWHDHTNGRFGLGYDIGPFERPWITAYLSYEITSLDLDELKNRFGVGVELEVVNWLAPLIHRLPAGDLFLQGYDWLNRRILMPVLYVQLFHVDAPPFSGRPPFHE